MAYLHKHNGLADFAARACAVADAVGAVWMLENPADRGDPLSPAFWARFSDHGCMWHMPLLSEVALATSASRATLAQCELGLNNVALTIAIKQG